MKCLGKSYIIGCWPAEKTAESKSDEAFFRGIIKAVYINALKRRLQRLDAIYIFWILAEYIGVILESARKRFWFKWAIIEMPTNKIWPAGKFRFLNHQVVAALCLWILTYALTVVQSPLRMFQQNPYPTVILRKEHFRQMAFEQSIVKFWKTCSAMRNCHQNVS